MNNHLANTVAIFSHEQVALASYIFEVASWLFKPYQYLERYFLFRLVRSSD